MTNGGNSDLGLTTYAIRVFTEDMTNGSQFPKEVRFPYVWSPRFVQRHDRTAPAFKLSGDGSWKVKP